MSATSSGLGQLKSLEVLTALILVTAVPADIHFHTPTSRLLRRTVNNTSPERRSNQALESKLCPRISHISRTPDMATNSIATTGDKDQFQSSSTRPEAGHSAERSWRVLQAEGHRPSQRT